MAPRTKRKLNYIMQFTHSLTYNPTKIETSYNTQKTHKFDPTFHNWVVVLTLLALESTSTLTSSGNPPTLLLLTTRVPLSKAFKFPLFQTLSLLLLLSWWSLISTATKCSIASRARFLAIEASRTFRSASARATTTAFAIEAEAMRAAQRRIEAERVSRRWCWVWKKEKLGSEQGGQR